MQLIKEIMDTHSEFTQFRRDLHANPELAFEETRTAEFISDQLESYGIQVTRGIGKTGVVGTLTSDRSKKAIGLRADMDALPMKESNTFSHRSRQDGVMHGCGHDGHTVMLLAAARYLAATKSFRGTVQFIFQPAEEANDKGSGAKAMIENGLFDCFAMDRIFAVHNAPGLKAGAIATRPGPIMASMDLFEVTLRGHGTHGGFPHKGNDPVVVAAQLVTAWQTIVSRNINPHQCAVVSATSVTTNDSWNVIGSTTVIRGSIRTLSGEAQKLIKNRFLTLTQSLAEGFGVVVEIKYLHETPVTVNDGEQTDFACNVAASIVGEENILRNASPVMGSEDFSFMLQEIPGCYLWIGNTNPPNPPDLEAIVKPRCSRILDTDVLEVQDACMVHDPSYDFNDNIIPVGASLFVRLAENYLS